MTAVADSPVERSSASVSRLPALDGIRGIAVLAVMAFHTESRWLSGGFLGVDVFFVLSGFLIADILYTRLRGVGVRPVLADFWLRRARRLAPALLLLIAVVAMMRILDPRPGGYDAAPILAALTYTTNWYEIARGGTYFGDFGPPSPLLHTWSLAIEEQYYIIFPLLLIALLRILPRRRGLAVALMLLATVSAVWMLILAVRGAPEVRLYMGTDTRVQSLLIGAALGVAVGRKEGTLPTRATAVAGWTGLVVLAVSMLWVNDPEALFRGGFLVQACATAALIAAALQPGPINRLLSTRPLVWVGAVSYSAYLWHYPIFAWVQASRPGVAAIGAQLWTIVLTLFVAYLSARFIERPFLQGGFTRLSALRQWAVYLSVAVVIAASCLIPADAFNKTKQLSWPQASQLPGTMLIMGDSTAFGLDIFFPADDLPGIDHGGTYEFGCGFSGLPYRFRGGVADVARCQSWRERTTEFIASRQPQATVIQSHAWVAFDRIVDGRDMPPGTPEFDQDYQDSLRAAIEVGGDGGRIPVYVLKIGCLAPLEDAEIIGDPKRIAIINNLTASVVASMPNAHVVETAGITCRNGRPVEEGDNPRYRDDGMHWSRVGARVVWNTIANEMAKSPLAP